MAITLDGSAGITSTGGYTGDGIVLADGTPSNTLVTTTGGLVGIGTGSPAAKLEAIGEVRLGRAAGTQYFQFLGDATNNRITVEGVAKPLLIKNNSSTTSAIAFDQAVDSNYTFSQSGTVKMILNSSGNVGVGTVTPYSKLHVDTGGVTTSAGGFTLRNAANQAHHWYLSDNVTSTFEVGSGSGVFRWINGNGEAMRVDGNAYLLVGKTSANTTAPGVWLYTQPDGYGRINFIKGSASGTGSTPACQFYYNGTAVGGINNSSTATTYGTSSDYRLKENVQPMQGALATVAALKPVTYTWKADGSQGQGFIAHELQEVVPDCVTGTKDAVDAEGNPQYQGVDTSFLVATLVKAIQELKAEVDALKGAA